MGWAQDAKDDPRQLRLPGFEPQEQPDGNSSNAGAVKFPSKWGQKTFEEHAKECKAQSKETCPIFKRELPKELAKPENRGKSEEEVANELWARHQGYKQQEEQKKAAKKAESLEKEIPLTPQQVLPQPKELEADGVDVVVATTVGEMTVEGLKSLIENPDVSDEIREEAKKQLELLSKNPATAVTEKTATGPAEATAAQSETTQAQPPEIDWANAISDDLYGKIKDTPEIKAYKQNLIAFLLKNRNFDASQLPKGSVKERVLNEALADLQAIGQKVSEYRETPLEVDDLDFAVSDTEEGGAQGEGTPPNPNKPNDLRIEDDWEVQRQEALNELAKLVGAAAASFWADKDDNEFRDILGRISKLAHDQKRWLKSAKVSGARRALREGLIEKSKKNIVGSADDLLKGQIKDILGNNELPISCRASLESILRQLEDPYLAEEKKQRVYDKYARLVSQYGLEEEHEGTEEDKTDEVEYRPENLRIFNEKYKGKVADSTLLDPISAQKENRVDLEELSSKISEAMESRAYHLGDLIQSQTGPSHGVLTYEVPPGFNVHKANGSELIQNLNLETGSNISSIEAGEYPNTIKITFQLKEPRNVGLREVVESKEWKEQAPGMAIPNAVGLDSTGKTIVQDAAKGPHELVTGATSSGKSVYLQNKILAPKLVKSPNEWKQVLIDPKQQEFGGEKDSVYNWCPVQFSTQGAAIALERLVQEMHDRAATLGIDLSKYNEMTGEGPAQEDLSKNLQSYNQTHKGQELPFISLVIDEVQALTQDKEFGKSINQNLSELLSRARSVGINVTLASQSDRVENVPGFLRSNLPVVTRFRAASSDTKASAEVRGLTHPGNFIQTNANSGKQIQGRACFLNNSEIGRVHNFYKDQAEKTGWKGVEGQAAEATAKLIEKLSTTPDAKEKLTAIAERVSKGNLQPFSVGELAAEPTKKLLDSLGIPYEATKRTDGKVIIAPKTPETSPEPTPSDGNASGGESAKSSSSPSLSDELKQRIKPSEKYPLTVEENLTKDFPVGTIVERSDGRQYIRAEGTFTHENGTISPLWLEHNRHEGRPARNATQSHALFGTSRPDEGGSRIVSMPENASATGTSGGAEATLPDNGTPDNKTPENKTATPNPERDSIEESLRPRYDAEQGALEQRIADAAAARDKVLNGNRKPTEQQAAWELYEDTVNAAIEKANGWRVANGLPKIMGLDKSGKFEYEKPAEEVSEADGTGDNSGQENADETTASKHLTRQEYEAKYPQTREGQMRRVKEERDAALDAKWQELAEKGLSPAQIKQDKGYKGLLKTYADEEAEINEQFPEQQSVEAAGQQNSSNGNAGITIKEDASKLTGDNKLQYEAALNDYNRGMANLREQRKNGEISGKEFREGAAQLLNDLNTERAEVGFTQPVDAAGAFKEPEQEEGNESATSTATSPETATAKTDEGTEEAGTETPAETQQNQENTEQVDEQNAETQEAPKRTRYTSTVNEANYAGDDELSMEAEDFNETIQELNDKKDGIGLKRNEQRLSAKEYIRRVNEAIDTFNAALKEAGRENEQLPKFAQRKETQPKAGEEKKNETGSDVNGGNTDREVKGTEVVSSEVKAGTPETREERSDQDKVDGFGEVKSEAEAVRSDDAGGGDDTGGDDDTGGGGDPFEEAMKLTDETIGKRISGLSVGKRRSLEDMFSKSQQDWTDEQRKAFLTKAGNYLEKNRKLSLKGTQEYLSELANKISNVDVKTKNVEQTAKNGTVNKSDDNRENTTASGPAEVEKTKNGSDRQSEVKRTEAVEETQAVAQKPEETSSDDTVVTEEDDTADQGGNAATQTNPEEQEETAETSEEQSAVETKEETHQQNETGGTSASRPLTDEEVAEKVNNNPYIKELEERRKQAKSNGVRAKLAKKIKETKKFLEGAIRNANSPDSGVQDVRTLKWRESDGGTGGSEELKKAVKEDASVVEARKQLEKAEQSGKDSNVYQEAKENLERTINNARINAASKKFLAKFGDSHDASDKEIKQLEKALKKEKKDSPLAERLQQQLENAIGKASTIDKTMAANARRNAASLMKAIENNDADYLKRVFQGPASHLNGNVSYQEDMGSRDAFEMLTGIKLPEARVELGDFEPTGQVNEDGEEIQAYSNRLNKWIDDFCAANRQSKPAPTQVKRAQEPKPTGTASKEKETSKTAKASKTKVAPKKKNSKAEEIQSTKNEVSAPDTKSAENPLNKTAKVSGGVNADYNKQSKEVRQQAKEGADLSKSRGMQILSEMKAPEKIDGDAARSINAKLAGVAREIQILEHKLNDEENPLSKKDRTQALGLIENLRQGLQDVYMKNRLGEGNFTFSPQKVDNRIVGLTIKDYKGADGEMHPVNVSEKSDFSKMSKSEKISAVKNIIDRETLRQPNRGTSTEMTEAATKLVEAVSKKDTESLAERLRLSNPAERTAFEAMTGTTLPSDAKGTLKAIDDYCGISEEQRDKLNEQKAQKRQKEAEKAAAHKDALEKARKTQEEKRIQREDKMFQDVIGSKGTLWDANQEEQPIEDLLKKGWRFEKAANGEVGFWSPDGDGYFIDEEMQEKLGDFDDFVAGAIRYGENLDKKASKPTKGQ